MTFEELWEEVWKNTKLPKEAKKFLPQSLSEKTKERLLDSGLSPSDISGIIESAVEKINHGSVESIDKLVITAINR